MEGLYKGFYSLGVRSIFLKTAVNAKQKTLTFTFEL